MNNNFKEVDVKSLNENVFKIFADRRTHELILQPSGGSYAPANRGHPLVNHGVPSQNPFRAHTRILQAENDRKLHRTESRAGPARSML